MALNKAYTMIIRLNQLLSEHHHLPEEFTAGLLFPNEVTSYAILSKTY